MIDFCFTLPGTTRKGRVYRGIFIDGVQWYAHRAVYVAAFGRIPRGFVVHHTCEDPRCCNPHHLIAVSPLRHSTALHPENWAAKKAARTHCPRGHPLEGDNLVPHQLRRGHRECLTCNRARPRTSRRRGQAAPAPQ